MKHAKSSSYDHVVNQLVVRTLLEKNQVNVTKQVATGKNLQIDPADIISYGLHMLCLGLTRDECSLQYVVRMPPRHLCFNICTENSSLIV